MHRDPLPELPLASLRQDYMARGLSEADLDPDPFRQFAAWFSEALASGVREPNAMVLSTATPGGSPRGRFVLLKGYGRDGFHFFTNTRSDKGRALSLNPQTALTFGWLEVERQICIEGRAEPLPREAVEAYFAKRPRGSRLGAWASEQSRVLPDRAALERLLAEAEAAFPEGAQIPAPHAWGGYRVVPHAIEFWQGRTNRLHDRLRYRKTGDEWKIERLAP
ncbi:MAG: pyridoxamine 5'-phosphate oxidase [Verrucomicrobium sp.]|nr:pyridoxamine 5'-phosphate oxidase [Verrucomicrobium sp.]